LGSALISKRPDVGPPTAVFHDTRRKGRREHGCTPVKRKQRSKGQTNRKGPLRKSRARVNLNRTTQKNGKNQGRPTGRKGEAAGVGLCRGKKAGDGILKHEGEKGAAKTPPKVPKRRMKLKGEKKASYSRVQGG